MKPKAFILFSILIFLVLPQFVFAATPIAKIDKFDGDVVILSGTDIIKVTKTGQDLYQGDRVQTKKGTMELSFTDGAVMKFRPYTSALVQQREEKSGFFIFKTKKLVLRITCFVGKLRFKSGSSNRKNILQTPTAVCGLRGTETDLGFDPAEAVTYVNMLSGTASFSGAVVEGFFNDPGIDAATKSAVFNQIQQAYNKSEEAKATGSKAAEAQAVVEVFAAVKEAAVALQNNPDETVAAEAAVVSIATDANIAAAEAVAEVEALNEAIEADPEVSSNDPAVTAQLQAAQDAANAAQTSADEANALTEQALTEIADGNTDVDTTAIEDAVAAAEASSGDASDAVAQVEDTTGIVVADATEPEPEAYEDPEPDPPADPDPPAPDPLNEPPIDDNEPGSPV